MPSSPVRRLVAIPIAAASLAAIGAVVFWIRPPHEITRSPAPIVIGGPGSPVPPGLAPGRSGAAEDVTPSPAPEFALTVLSPGAPLPSTGLAAGARPVRIPAAGGTLTLSALRGHPVVVNFWGSWCAPCRAEMPLLVKASHAYAARGVVVVGLDVDDTPAEARPFLELHHVDYPIVTVPDQRLPRAYGVIGLPMTVFIDSSGMIRARQLGGFAGQDGERTLTRHLDALLAGAASNR